MCVGSKPSAPPPVVLPPAPEPVEAPAPQPQAQDPQVQTKRNDSRLRRIRAAQGNQTLVTGGAGLQDEAQTGLKSAFGA